MAALEPTNSKTQVKMEDEFKQQEFSLQKDQMWFGYPMFLYQGFWCRYMYFDIVTAFQIHFQAQDTHIISASLPKTGTTWLKSLIFSIVNREKYCDGSQHPLHSNNPHELILNLDLKLYKNILLIDQQDLLPEIPSPRPFATHMSYLPLPESIKTSKCKIVYVCRNPLNTFASACHFWLNFDVNKTINFDMEMMEEYVDMYCKGIFPFGPYEDHLLGYWKESMQTTNKVFFLEYEGLKKEPNAHVKKLAEFIGYPFSEEEEKENIFDKVVELCSLKSLKQMEVNKSDKCFPWFENKAFFRKGEFGDWSNYLTISMAKRIDEMLEKLKKAGFNFTYYQTIL